VHRDVGEDLAVLRGEPETAAPVALDLAVEQRAGDVRAERVALEVERDRRRQRSPIVLGRGIGDQGRRAYRPMTSSSISNTRASGAGTDNATTSADASAAPGSHAAVRTSAASTAAAGAAGAAPGNELSTAGAAVDRGAAEVDDAEAVDAGGSPEGAARLPQVTPRQHALTSARRRTVIVLTDAASHGRRFQSKSVHFRRGMWLVQRVA